MNRQIKFRGWHPKTNEMLIHEWGIGDGDDGYICSDKNGDAVYVGEVVWQQFTGLLDKNGREIYEGDIVFASYLWPTDDEEWEKNKKTYEVIWAKTKYGKKPGWELNRVDNKDRIFYGEWPDAQFVEIIGNIFENPELLQ